MLDGERPLLLHNLVDTVVGVEVCLNIFEDGDRAVSSSTAGFEKKKKKETNQYCSHSIINTNNLPEDTSASDLGRDTNRVVEGETERLARLLATLATVEELVLERVAESKERAAGGVGSGVDAVGASDAAGERT